MRHRIVGRRERLEDQDSKDFGGVDVPVRGGVFVRPAGGSGLVGARDGLLHRRSLPDSAAPPWSKAAGAAAFAQGLRARHGRNDELLDVMLPKF
jgi:hypothetical protein